MEYARSRPHAMLTHASALAVFLVRMLQFRYAFDANWALSVAKGAGLTVLWLLGLVYVSKLRMLAWFVSEALRPWTSHTSWHAHAGLGAATWSLVHTVAHLCRPGHPAWARRGAHDLDGRARLRLLRGDCAHRDEPLGRKRATGCSCTRTTFTGRSCRSCSRTAGRRRGGPSSSACSRR